MLAHRIIPVMLVRGRTLVKGRAFDAWRSVGHAAQAASVHARRQVDELLILDIAATAEGRGPDLGLIRELARDCFIPITVGGGVRSLGDIDQLLRSGADKVAICSAAYEVPGLISAAARRFGSQAIVGVVDYKWAVLGCCGDGHLTTFIRCGTGSVGRAVEEGGLAVEPLVPQYAAYWLQEEGAGEILLSAIPRDGCMNGYDLDTLRTVANWPGITIPVIASGGCSGPEDMAAAIRAGASAVAAGALFQFTDHTPRSCAQFLHAQGMTVRLQ